jgi:hypothetical protein
MARDYKQQRVNKKQVFKRKSQQAQQGIVEKDGISFNLVFRFLLVLLFLSLIVIFYQFSDLFQDDELEVQTPSLELNETKKPDLKLVVNPLEQPKRTIKTIDYSFYNGLAETEVVVDIDPISIKLDSLYFIQAGTFGKEKQALIEQKRLKKFGQELAISTFKTSLKTYYRLRVGPFDDRLEMNKKRNELRRLGLDTLLIKSKKNTEQLPPH